MIFVPTVLVGSAIIRTNARNVVGWIFLVAGAAQPLSVLLQLIADAAYVQHRRVPAPAVFALVGGFISVFGVTLILLFGLLLFPDGRLADPGTPIRRRTRVLAWTCVVMGVALIGYVLFAPTLDGTSAENVHSPIGFGPAAGLLAAVLLLGPVGLFICAHLVGRARRAATADQRRALGLAARVSFLVPGAFFVCLIVGLSGGNTVQISVIENLAPVAIGVASWVGIIRYGLFDRRTVLSRTVVYAALTALVVVIYLGVDALLGLAFDGAIPAVVAAALGALVALPVRDVVQRRVNRLVFGLRDEPAAAFGLLAVRLDAAAAPDEVLPAVVTTIAEALRLRYVQIEVDGQEVARWGTAVAGPQLEFDLPFAGESIGRLSVQGRDPDQPFARPDRELLESLASQVSVAARAVALTHALQGFAGTPGHLPRGRTPPASPRPA